jgi:hypothetical protein
MAQYQLRLFFDPGAGTCLWAGNDAARERFGYAVDASTLPMSMNTGRRVLYLCAWYDTSINWEYPPDPSPWDDAEWERFRAEVRRVLMALREQLGPEFDIVDESD